MDERREHRRYSIWFPVTIDVGAVEVWAICRDASKRGILIATSVPIDEGTRVKVSFRVAHTEQERTIEGCVVRLERKPEASGMWPHNIGIEFDEEIPELEGKLARHSSSPPPPDRAP